MDNYWNLYYIAICDWYNLNIEIKAEVAAIQLNMLEYALNKLYSLYSLNILICYLWLIFNSDESIYINYFITFKLFSNSTWRHFDTFQYLILIAKTWNWQVLLILNYVIIFFLRFLTNAEDFLETTIKVGILKQITGYDSAEIG